MIDGADLVQNTLQPGCEPESLEPCAEPGGDPVSLYQEKSDDGGGVYSEPNPGRDDIDSRSLWDGEHQREADREERYVRKAAYGSAPNYGDLVKAIAAFERTLVFLDTPLDRFLAGKNDAMSAEAKQGWDLFNGKARCVSCHTINSANPSGSDSRFHNIGVAARTRNFEALARQALHILEDEGGLEEVDRLALQTNMSELGRFLVTKNHSDIGAFKTEQLRNVGMTAPYMHDGSMRTLWDVMDHYNKGGEANPYLDGGIEPLALTEPEINAVVALLFAMTDDRFAEQNRKAFEEQRKIAQQRRPFRDEALAMRQILPFERRVLGKTEEGSPGGKK